MKDKNVPWCSFPPPVSLRMAGQMIQGCALLLLAITAFLGPHGGFRSRYLERQGLELAT